MGHKRVVLITGGGGGIGRAAAHRFAEDGAIVVITDLDADKLQQVVKEIELAGGQAEAVVGDVSSEMDVGHIVGHVLREFGRIDVLVNNAAICPQVRLTDMTLAQWNAVMTNNLTSVFLLSRAVIGRMQAQGGGAIVNVSSVHALATLDGYSAYSASKAGIVGLTRALALDFAPDNIRVNAVLPGAVHTPMLEGSIKRLDLPREQIMEQWDQSQPLGRVGQPEEIAETIWFVAHPRNSFMTGANLVVDGGMTAQL